MQNSIACPTYNQRKIHKVFKSRIQDLTMTQVCNTQDNVTKSKSTWKKCYKAMIQKQSTEIKLKVLNQST